jgi:ATP-dependent helicase YprA (DUF1998 family)
MRVAELVRYNIPEKIIDSWISQVGEDLLPVQERAIKRYGILEGNSLLISSPTTSGKTFAGEIAAVKGVMEKKKVAYLVPLKSLAEEKYLDFKEKYQEFGIKVVVSSRDHKPCLLNHRGTGNTEGETFSLAGRRRPGKRNPLMRTTIEKRRRKADALFCPIVVSRLDKKDNHLCELRGKPEAK